ncbi:metal-dependent hydrolase [Pseudonocardia spinosispora]|uniref:metal-dependent hydrolase n=1 Tax=Pseudonocardia spinosispora TaxID=103441 RepID=UPI00040C5C2C|nr:metal-dependent hydrolase [Pseudonocardia spinosispora]
MSNELADPDKVSLRPREVEFDWSQLPMHWVPNDPFATHLLNVLHLLLPEGERWFVKVFAEALPLVRDEQVAEDVRGFIGQEALHAASHQGVLDHLNTHGLDTEPYVAQVRWLFRKALGDREFTGRKAAARRDAWLIERVAGVATIEHFTAVLGDAILNAPGLDAAGTDPVMLDMLRWHGAEEVEHRAVAFDLYQHLDGRYWPRVRQMMVVAPGMALLWIQGVRFLMANDPTGKRKPRLRDAIRLPRYGLPSLFALIRSCLPYLRRDYHPSQHGSTSQAVAYLASSPAAMIADARAGR